MIRSGAVERRLTAPSRAGGGDPEGEPVMGRIVDLCGEGAGGGGETRAWTRAVEGHAAISTDVIRQLAHRVDRLEEILEAFRDQKGPDRKGFDALQRRLMDQGIEEEMRH